MCASDNSDNSDRSAKSDNGNDSERLLPKHGGYQRLRSFQAAQLVYDATVVFCGRFIDKRSRTHDQMVQAARSGVQNIAEGSMASGTSKKTEIKLTNVARASLEELRLDYQDFLRQRRLRLWDKASPEAWAVRHMYRGASSDKSDRSDQSDNSASLNAYQIPTASAETVANTILCLIHQASALLGRQLERLEQDFQEHGGFNERLYRVRSNLREREGKGPGNNQSPACPSCGKPMRLRTAGRGRYAGQKFWGCSVYPECTGIRQVEGG